MGLILFGLGLCLGGFFGLLAGALCAAMHEARVEEERSYTALAGAASRGEE